MTTPGIEAIDAGGRRPTPAPRGTGMVARFHYQVHDQRSSIRRALGTLPYWDA